MEAEGEGYRPSRVVFEMFDYIFLLVFSCDDREWVLEIDRLPARLPPRARRANRRRRNAVEQKRQAAAAARMRRARITRLVRLVENWEQTQLGRKLTAFFADTSTLRDAHSLAHLASQIRVPLLHRPQPIAPLAVIEMSRRFAASTQDFRDLILVSAPLSTVRAVIDRIFSFEPQSIDELWDVSWFGELPQPSELTT
ncbi:MAG: hypothetical protein AB7O98_01940 [Hyphomonadaceae bacterium]